MNQTLYYPQNEHKTVNTNNKIMMLNCRCIGKCKILISEMLSQEEMDEITELMRDSFAAAPTEEDREATMKKAGLSKKTERPALVLCWRKF